MSESTKTKRHVGSCRLAKIVSGRDKSLIFRCLDCGKEIK